MSTTKQRDPCKERFWRRMLGQWRNSGMSARAFCRLRQLSEANFYAWRRTLAQRDAQALKVAPARFLPVRLVPAAADATPDADDARPGLELCLRSGRRLRIGSAFDASTLRGLLVILEERQEGRPCS